MPELSDVTRGRILYGGDYHPGQWPRSVWREDIRLMREARVTTATVGMFSWTRLEPRPGCRRRIRHPLLVRHHRRPLPPLHQRRPAGVLHRRARRAGRPHIPVTGRRLLGAHGAELSLLGGVVGRGVPARAALLHDWHAWWATVQDGRPSARLDYPQVVRAWHQALWEENLTTDFAHPHADLSDYALVAVPHLYLLTDEALDNLTGHVRGGTTLVCGFFTGVAGEHDQVRPGGADRRLRDLLGIRTVHEWWPLDEGETLTAHGPSWPAGLTATLWSEGLEPSTAETMARIKGGELDGGPAVTRNRHGAGTAWCVSTLPEPAALRALLARAAGEAGLRPPLPGISDGVEAVARGDHLFLLNHGRSPRPSPSVRADRPAHRPRVRHTGPPRPLCGRGPDSARIPHPKGAAPCTEPPESSS